MGKGTRLNKLDVGAVRNLEAVTSISCFDRYLKRQIIKLMQLVDADGQLFIVDIIAAYVFRTQRMRYGNHDIDDELRHIFNRAEVIKYFRTGIRPQFITKNGCPLGTSVKKNKKTT